MCCGLGIIFTSSYKVLYFCGIGLAGDFEKEKVVVVVREECNATL
jgi:hypothetical protein